MSEDIKIKHGSLQELKNIEIDDGVIYFAKDDNFLNGKIYYDNPSGEGRINVSGVGYDISGQTIDGYIAGLGAEIFNDYSKREYVEDNYGNVITFQGNIASGDYSHAEGYATTASESCAHAEGWSTITSGQAAHAEGYNTKASGDYSHTEGYNVKALGEASHAEGHLTRSEGNYSHAEGESTIAIGKGSHAEGTTDSIIKYVVKITTSTVDNEYIIEGISYDELFLDQYVMIDSGISKIMSKSTRGEVISIITERPLSTTPLTNADAIIISTGSIGDYSHTEGWNTTAGGVASHAEGYNIWAKGDYSHAEGCNTTAEGVSSHAEGIGVQAIGVAAHAGGVYTIANGQGQTVIGQFNKPNTTDLFIIGNGIGEHDRSNAFTVDQDGYISSPGGGSGGGAASYDSEKQSWSMASRNITVETPNGNSKCAVVVGLWGPRDNNTPSASFYPVGGGGAYTNGVDVGDIPYMDLGSKSRRWKTGFIDEFIGVSADFSSYCYAPAWANPSDRRLKNIIDTENIEDYLKAYNNLNPVFYIYKNDKFNRKHLGLIAQDVEQELNKCNIDTSNSGFISVSNLEEPTEDLPDGKRYALDYNELHGLHTLKNQQQDARIKELEDENEILKIKLSSLEADLTTIKALLNINK